MKKLLIIVALFAIQAFMPRSIEAPIPVCQTTTHDMAAWAADPEFQSWHPAPLPYHYAGKGEMVSFAAPDGKEAKGFLLKAPKKSKKWLFVYQEWWGLNDNIKKEAENFYNDLKDVNVLALDMYDGQVGTTPQEAGKSCSQYPRSGSRPSCKGH